MTKTIEQNLTQQTLKKMTSVWSSPGLHLALLYGCETAPVDVPMIFHNGTWNVLTLKQLWDLQNSHKLKEEIRRFSPSTNLLITNVPYVEKEEDKTVCRAPHVTFLPEHLVTRASTISDLFYGGQLLYVAKARHSVKPGTMYGYKKDYKVVIFGQKRSSKPFQFLNLYSLTQRGIEILDHIQDRCTGPQIRVLKNLRKAWGEGNRFDSWTKTNKVFRFQSLKAMEKLGIVEVKEGWKDVVHNDGSFSTHSNHRFKLTPLGQVFLDCSVVM